MKRLFLSLALICGVFSLHAQEASTDVKKKETYVFTPVKELKITPVKNQSRSGTCWSFSGIGFWEAEMLRMGKQPVNLSEMFVVSHSYKDKAVKYIRTDGHINFAQGGSFYDVLYVLKHYGAVPSTIMPGLNYGTTIHAHSELEAGAMGFLKGIEKNPNKKLSTAWKRAFDSIIDAYLGELPTEFSYNGKKYTPKSFAESIGLDADNYVSLTSYTHVPFYSSFVMEIADNWRHSSSYNLPLDELMATMKNAINTGYAIAWGSDVSEPGFTRDGYALLVDVESAENSGSDQARWVGATPSQRNEMIRDLVTHINTPEIKVTQEYRQEGYNNKTTTDDHGMVIYGIAKDQTGKLFFMVKNSWGETGKYKGIWYASEAFVAGKTMNIVVHKNAIPKEIRAKLGLK